MNLTVAREKFFKNNPHVFASFLHNEKLDKYFCYTYNYTKSGNSNVLISDSVKKAISETVDTDAKSYFEKIIHYYEKNGIDNDLLNKLSDCYYTALINGTVFTSTDDVCDYINAQTSSTETTNDSKRVIIAAYPLEENGDLSNDRCFYMEISFQTKNNTCVCVIENTFTDENYRNCGMHGCGVKFLEAVLAEIGVSVIIGESVDMDLYQGKSLDDHYRKLGFEVTTNKYGESQLYKYVEPEQTMQIKPDKIKVK